MTAMQEFPLAYIDPGSGSFLVQALVATAAGLARGMPLRDSVSQAKKYVTEVVASEILLLGGGDNNTTE